MSLIALINGPHNGRQIEDSGADPIRLGIFDDTGSPILKVGVATYRRFPLFDPEGQKAFWDGNDWDGTLVDSFPA